MYELTENVVSMFKKKTYGTRGERVKLIALHDNVAIVEKVKTAERFTVQVANLKEVTK